MHRDRNQGVTQGFLDILFNLVIGLTVLIILAFLLIQDNKKSETPDLSLGMFILDWEPDKDIDNDIWIRDPTGHVLSFMSGYRTTPLLALDRDDTGTSNEAINAITKKRNPLNREIVTIRAWKEGTWTVNVMAYGIKHGALTETTFNLTLLKLSPYEEIFNTSYTLVHRQEITVVTFNTTDTGEIFNIKMFPPTIPLFKRAINSVTIQDTLGEGR